jgi:hypothetical protein
VVWVVIQSWALVAVAVKFNAALQQALEVIEVNGFNLLTVWLGGVLLLWRSFF